MFNKELKQSGSTTFLLLKKLGFFQVREIHTYGKMTRTFLKMMKKDIYMFVGSEKKMQVLFFLQKNESDYHDNMDARVFKNGFQKHEKIRQLFFVVNASYHSQVIL